MLKDSGDRARLGRKWPPIGGLVLLSLLWAVGWVRADLSPGSDARLRLTPLWGETALLGVFARLAGVAALVRNRPWSGWRVARTAVLVGFGLFVAPAVVVTLASGWIDDSTRVSA
jgi:hypothetical protein